MAGLRSRNKGKRGERATAAEIRAAFPHLAAGVRRGWQARAGADDPDVIGLPGFWVEVKTGKQPNVRAALTQAAQAVSGENLIPLAVVRDDRRPPIAVLRWHDLLSLLRRPRLVPADPAPRYDAVFEARPKEPT